MAAVNDYDLPTAKLLMAHVLAPIDDPERFRQFSQEFLDLVASRAASSDPRAKAFEQQPEPNGPSATKDPKALVSLFQGPERLLASNALVAADGGKCDDAPPRLKSTVSPTYVKTEKEIAWVETEVSECYVESRVQLSLHCSAS